MAYQKKYYYSFVPTGLTETHLVELWQDTATPLTAEEIKGGVPPFVVDMPTLDSKFQVVRGTGCSMQLLSDTDMKFFDGLYHVDMKEFLILKYIDGTLDWCGYLNSEMFRESYAHSENYIVETTGNDGFNLMDRLFFNQSDASKYTGLKSEWELIQICLDKIGLPYTDIRVSLSTTFTGYVGATGSTILHETYIESSNFYDEDEKPMTLREVLASVLEPYGAFIVQSGGSVYITDVHTLAGGGSITYNQYNASTYAYIAQVVETNEKTVTSVGYFGTGQSIEISGGTNRQLVRYSPYPNKDISEELLVAPGEFDTVPALFSVKDGYSYRTLSDHIYYSTGGGSDFEESINSETGDRSVYLRHVRLGTFTGITGKFPYVAVQSAKLVPNLVTVVSVKQKRYFDGVSIIISGRCLVKTKANPYNDTYSLLDKLRGAKRVDGVALQYGFAIGGKSYYQTDDVFLDGVITNNYMEISDNGSVISNKWIDFSHKMSVTYADEDVLIEGAMQFLLFQGIKYRLIGEDYIDLPATDSPIQEVWIKNLDIRVANIDGTEISDSDIEYIGELDKKFLKQGDEVSLTTGTGSVFIDRGKKCYNDGTNYKVISEWTRESQTYNVEELLLNSLSSNYRSGYITLNNMNLKNSFSLLNVLTDTSTGTRKMMVKSLSRDYYSNTTNTELVEITEDELTIVKE